MKENNVSESPENSVSADADAEQSSAKTATASSELGPEGALEPGLVQVVWRGLKRLDRAALVAAKRLWHEGIEGGGPTWPPKWFAGTLIVLGVLLCAQVVVPLIGIIAGRLSIRFLDIVQSVSIPHVIVESVHAYILSSAPSIGVSGQALWLGWSISGVALFILACLAVRGAQIGWALFGVVSTALAVAGSSSAGRILVGGVAVVLWALLSTFALRRSSRNDDKSESPRKKKTNTREVAESRAQELEFDSLAVYFYRRRHLKPDELSDELGIDEEATKKLRREVGGITKAGETPVWIKRKAVEEALSEGADRPRIAGKYEVGTATLVGWIKNFGPELADDGMVEKGQIEGT